MFYVIDSRSGEFALISVMVDAEFVQMAPDTGTLFYDSTLPGTAIEETDEMLGKVGISEIWKKDCFPKYL